MVFNLNRRLLSASPNPAMVWIDGSEYKHGCNDWQLYGSNLCGKTDTWAGLRRWKLFKNVCWIPGKKYSTKPEIYNIGWSSGTEVLAYNKSLMHTSGKPLIFLTAH